MGSRRQSIPYRPWVALWVFATFLPALSSAAEGSSRRNRFARHQGSEAMLRSDQTDTNMTPRTLMTIRTSYRSAFNRLARNSSCRALFKSLDRDGLEVLGTSMYGVARSRREQAVCRPGVAAATRVGHHRVLICKRFQSLPPSTRAAILIHEALHSAGLGEAPHHPEAMTSKEITELVKEACSL